MFFRVRAARSRLFHGLFFPRGRAAASQNAKRPDRHVRGGCGASAARAAGACPAGPSARSAPGGVSSAERLLLLAVLCRFRVTFRRLPHQSRTLTTFSLSAPPVEGQAASQNAGGRRSERIKPAQNRLRHAVPACFFMFFRVRAARSRLFHCLRRPCKGKPSLKMQRGRTAPSGAAAEHPQHAPQARVRPGPPHAARPTG